MCSLLFVIMGDWLTETLNLGAFDYLYKFTIILAIFLLGGSFIVKKKKEEKKLIDNVDIACKTVTEVLVKE